MKDWVFFLLGIAAPILAGQLFKDNFYFAIILTGIALLVLFLVVIKATRSQIIAIILMLVVLAVMSGYFRFCCQYPAFEISFIGLPYNDDGYYLTNSLISSQGDLSDYDDMTLLPIHVEIKPSYSGNANFGNLALQVSQGELSETYPLWASFDSSSKTETITLPTEDLIRLSSILQTHELIESNLKLDGEAYPQAALTLQIIPLSDPKKPYKNSEILQISNTPWIQHAQIARRDEIYVDYALQNLGPETTFHCRITVAKSSEVTGYDHDFWSDAQVFSYGPYCDPFRLKPGETFSTSFALSKETMGEDFSVGRYLVQVYSFAERDDIQLENGASYETVGNPWLLANNGDLLTFIVCNQPGRTCHDSIEFPIEMGNLTVFPYSSKDEHGNGYTDFQMNAIAAETKTNNEYILNYSLDPSKKGWVGLALVFGEHIDISAFNALRFDIQMDESPHTVWIQISSAVEGVDDTNSRVKIGDGIIGTTTSEVQTITIPFSHFADIDWTKVTAINLVIDEYMVPDAYYRGLVISGLKFIRE